MTRLLHYTTDHRKIRDWVEAKGGRPSQVKGPGNDEDFGPMRIDFPGDGAETHEEVSWAEFFQKFEEKNLAFVFQDEMPDARDIRSCKLVSRDRMEEAS